MILITDIDHTIADAAWRDDLWYESNDKYHDAADRDQPIEVMVELVRKFSKMPDWQVIGLTARPERYRKATNAWLHRHNVHLHVLLMRPDNDMTADHILKVRLITENIKDTSIIAAVLEDRYDCVNAFLKIGLNVIQYHYGIMVA